jgi:signal transduction histidine kinase
MSKRDSSPQLLLSYNTKRALVKGTVVAVVTAVVYLAIVVITTPSLPAIATINAAFKVNSIVIFGLAIGVGIQFFLTSYSKGLGCRLDKRRKGIFGGSSGSTALSSFFSFFSLVPLGCCGSWLLILSMLPSVFGSSLSVVLIEYSRLLSYIGLAIVFGFAGLSALKLKKELQQRNSSKNSNFNQLNGQHLAEIHDEKNKKEEVRI